MHGHNISGGVEFHHGTGNYRGAWPTICGSAVFTTHSLTTGRRVSNTYRLNMHPDGWEIQKQIPTRERKSPEQEWDTINYHAHREDVLALLPDEVFAWTWQNFLLALTFYGYGEEDGAYRVQLEWESSQK